MNQVLARSINTSFVAIMPVFCILVIGSWILGASALNDFGLALFIGLMSGAYSSIFIASPILAILKEREPRYVEIRRRLAAYPSSRQVLTPATVAGGVLLGAAKTAGAGVVGGGTGTSFAGAGTATSFASSTAGPAAPSAGAAEADVVPGRGWRRPTARRSNGGTANGGTANGGTANGVRQRWWSQPGCGQPGCSQRGRRRQRCPRQYRRARPGRRLRELRRAAAASSRRVVCSHGTGPARCRGPRPGDPARPRPSAGGRRRWHRRQRARHQGPGAGCDGRLGRGRQGAPQAAGSTAPGAQEGSPPALTVAGGAPSAPAGGRLSGRGPGP